MIEHTICVDCGREKNKPVGVVHQTDDMSDAEAALYVTALQVEQLIDARRGGRQLPRFQHHKKTLDKNGAEIVAAKDIKK